VISAFLAGAAAGYAIAIPVGVIAVLILEIGLRRGFPVAFAAGAGAATADLIYATIAALFGTALVGIVGPLARPLRALSVIVLVVIAVRGLRGLRDADGSHRASFTTRSPRRTYVQLLGLTLLNPATVVYFAALILGLPSLGTELAERLAFIVGVGLASLSWQSLLAGIGSLAHTRLSPRVQFVVSVIGNVVVLLFALVILIGLIQG
jgi:threonine/homoserine/homoserine lactone efflux protein